MVSLWEKGSADLPDGVKKESAELNSPPSPASATLTRRPAHFRATEPEVEARFSHEAARGAYSNRTESGEEIMMAAPEAEVQPPAAVSGKAWGPELEESVSSLPLPPPVT